MESVYERQEMRKKMKRLFFWQIKRDGDTRDKLAKAVV